jgi:hypothetical protein
MPRGWGKQQVKTLTISVSSIAGRLVACLKEEGEVASEKARMASLFGGSSASINEERGGERDRRGVGGGGRVGGRWRQEDAKERVEDVVSQNLVCNCFTVLIFLSNHFTLLVYVYMLSHYNCRWESRITKVR